MSDRTAFKDYFDTHLAERLSRLLKPHYADFPAQTFVHAVATKVDTLELKARVALIADELKKALPADYTQSVHLLLHILGPENETEQGMFTNGYFLMPVAYFVEKYGLEHFNLSMHALYEITKRHTSEYAIRPYLAHHRQACIEILNRWTDDENLHVRRLVSEGTRPRLPWAKRIGPINGDPTCNLSLLERLMDDRSFYVRKSIANHLNDLTKEHAQATLAWIREQLHREREHTVWIARHGLRSLVKSGNREAIELLKKTK